MKIKNTTSRIYRFSIITQKLKIVSHIPKQEISFFLTCTRNILKWITFTYLDKKFVKSFKSSITISKKLRQNKTNLIFEGENTKRNFLVFRTKVFKVIIIHQPQKEPEKLRCTLRLLKPLFDLKQWKKWKRWEKVNASEAH